MPRNSVIINVCFEPRLSRSNTMLTYSLVIRPLVKEPLGGFWSFSTMAVSSFVLYPVPVSPCILCSRFYFHILIVSLYCNSDIFHFKRFFSKPCLQSSLFSLNCSGWSWRWLILCSRAFSISCLHPPFASLCCLSWPIHSCTFSFKFCSLLSLLLYKFLYHLF